MPVNIIDCEQRSDEWYKSRLGIVTASCMNDVLSKGAGKTRKTYMNKLIAERKTGEPQESYMNAAIQRGVDMEPEVLEMYKQVVEDECTEVGFGKNFEEIGWVGASPDLLVGEKGMAQFKTRAPHLQVEILLSQKIPSYTVKQMQCEMWVWEKDWSDFVSYCPKMEPFIKRVYRDEKMIDEMRMQVRQFYRELEQDLKRIGGIDV